MTENAAIYQKHKRRSLIIAIAFLILIAIYIVFCVSAYLERQRSEELLSECGIHFLELQRALLTYCDDHGGTFPSAAHWCDEILPYVKDRKAYVCPAAQNQTCSYAFNAALSGLKQDRIENADHVVMLFESDKGWNAAGGAELLTDTPRHDGGDRVATATWGNWHRRKRQADNNERWTKAFLDTDLEWTPHLRER